MRYLREGVKAGILERVELRALSGRYIRLAPFYGPGCKHSRSGTSKAKTPSKTR